MRILFVCTGNTCRSPLAEGLLRMKVRKEGLAAEVRSAGVSASMGGSISRNSQLILKEAGFEEAINSSAIQHSDVQWADLILTMTGSHKRAVIQYFPDAVEKTYCLKEYVEDDPRVLQAIEDRGRLFAELQLKQALGQAISQEERSRVTVLENIIPDYDISDPYGNSLDIYQRTAEEINVCLDKLIRKIRHSNFESN